MFAQYTASPGLGHASPQETHELLHPVIEILLDVGAAETKGAIDAKANVYTEIE